MISVKSITRNIEWTVLLIVELMLSVSLQQLSAVNSTTSLEQQISLTRNVSREQLCNVSTTFLIPGHCQTIDISINNYLKYDTASEAMRLTRTGSIETGTTSRYEIINKTMVHLCSPISPQLQNCELQRFGPDCYEISTDKLTVLDSHLSSELGDYFLDSDKNAYMCPQHIRPSKNRPRCNYIQLDMGQYTLHHDGSLYINATNSTLQNPIYTMDIQKKVNVCYPLDIHFLNCQIESAMQLRRYWYDKVSGLKIYYRAFRKMYNVDEYYSRNNNGVDMILCAPEAPLDANILYYVYSTLKCLSITLVLVTITHHSMAPKLTVHVKCLLSYYFSGMAYYIISMLPPIPCYAFFISTYLTANAAMIWVNIVSFDIWRSFTNMRNSSIKSNGSFKVKSDPYLHYCIIGWGFPIAMCFIVLLLDKYYAMQDVLFLSPMVGLSKNCWFHEKWISIGLHFGAITILAIINMVFFILTIYSIHKGSQGTDIVNKRRKKQMYLVRFKLFIIMGVTLVSEGIAFSVQEHFNFQFWYIADAFISIQGIAIFFVETCKKRAFQLMANRFRHNIVNLSLKFHFPIFLKLLRTQAHTSQKTLTSVTDVSV